MSAEIAHIPVALARCVDLLTPAIVNKSKPYLIDATLGLGGHAKAFLTTFPNLKLIGVDRDSKALEIATAGLSQFSDRTHLFHNTYDQIDSILNQLEIKAVDAILFDLGVSSMQLDQADRGFSYSQDAPLDMRMDQSQGMTAADVVNTYSAGQLADILREYGDEKFAMRIARRIVAARDEAPFTNSTRLVDLVREAIPAATRRTGGNPAKRTFQALRIETNDELGAITRAIPQALELLDIHARLVVMSFQSLEDRIVKNFFQEATTSGTPQGLPVEIAELAAKFALVFNGSQSPSEKEVQENSRAASVRLRAIERVAA